MEKPIIKLGAKQFLTGIAPNAHTETGGIFFKADGVTPLYDAGGTASTQNGLLQCGPEPENVGGSTVVDNIIASAETNYTGTPYLYFLGKDGHLYQKGIGAAAITDLRSGTQITFPSNGMVVWAPAGGTVKLHYWRQSKIGTWDLSGSYPTGWDDAAYDITTTNGGLIQPTHQFAGNVYFGNGYHLGALLDDGDGTASVDSNVLDLPSRSLITAVADDSTYLVLSAITNPLGANIFALNKIYFWDTHSVSWTREWEIRDPFIWALKSIGGAVYAFGQYGIYEVTFGGGVRKVLSRFIGFGTATDITLYGANRAAVYNGQSLIFATDTTVDTFGKLQPDVPSAHFKPFVIPSSVGTPTLVSASLDAGRVFVATDGAKLYSYDFNASTRDTARTAQTVYFSLPSKVHINRIDLVFGEPLATGDSVSASIYKDEDTAATSFGSATYAADGAIRRKSLFKQVVCEDQFSLRLDFVAGAPKIKAIEVYGLPMTP